ncbi:MAG: hypothetical protein BWK76_11565 [Desulfobulbaceae bacterium A2]|nr:MAG: hypothetical protein BWK76_11565 [Desulfobulbaceae bacterium A2]
MRGRGRSRWDDYYPPYVTVAEKKAKAEAARKKLAATTRGLLEPVLISGRAIAVTWWGKSWCDNLERYADYENRVPRGRSYVRSGAVLDLKIETGVITAKVSGSRAQPYTVRIELAPLAPAKAQRLREQCRSSLDSMQALLAGRFPAELREALFAKDSGMFPSPKELSFHCSCPDWASMCKHVAATLYGVGARLDERPSLFFTLRGLKVDDFVGQVVQEESERLLARADTVSERVIGGDDEDLADLFGITLEDAPVARTETQAPRRQRRDTPQATNATTTAAPLPGADTAQSTSRIATATSASGKGRRAALKAQPATPAPSASGAASPARKRGRPAKKSPLSADTKQAAPEKKTLAQGLGGRRKKAASDIATSVPVPPLPEASLDEQLLAAFEQARQRAVTSSAGKRENSQPPKRGRGPRAKD